MADGLYYVHLLAKMVAFYISQEFYKLCLYGASINVGEIVYSFYFFTR